MYNALSFNFYYLGNKDESIEMWNKLTQISKVDVGYAPWVIEESKTVFESRVLPLLLDDNNHYRLYGIFLLHQLNGKEILMTEDIWSILESMNDYEKLYLTYLVQGLTLNKLDLYTEVCKGCIILRNSNITRLYLQIGLIKQK